MAERVLITGCTGFLGRALWRVSAERGAALMGVSRSGAGEGHVAMDLGADRKGLRALLEETRPGRIFHLVGGPTDDPFATNVAPMRTLLAAIGDVTGYAPRVVVTGSAAEYGAAGDQPISEQVREQPVSEYGVAKLAQTQLALLARRRGMSITVARPFNLIGPGMPTGLAPSRFAREIVAARAAGRSWVEVGDLSPVRDYLEVDEASAALWAVSLSGADEAVVNVCSGLPVSMREIFDGLAEQAGVEIEPRPAPSLMRGKAEVPVSIGDPTRLSRLWGRAPTFSLRDALQRVLDEQSPSA